MGSTIPGSSPDGGKKGYVVFRCWLLGVGSIYHAPGRYPVGQAMVFGLNSIALDNLGYCPLIKTKIFFFSLPSSILPPSPPTLDVLTFLLPSSIIFPLLCALLFPPLHSLF